MSVGCWIIFASSCAAAHINFILTLVSKLLHDGEEGHGSTMGSAMRGKAAWACSARAFAASQNPRLPRLMAHACVRAGVVCFWTALALEGRAVELAVHAHVRHAHTRYDELLSRGVTRGEARGLVAEVVATRLEQWERGKP